MSTIRITGRACVYNEENSYGEILSPDAFSNSLKAIKSLPMLVDHFDRGILGGHQLGRWIKFDNREDGLYVTGELPPWTLTIIEKCGLKELSVSYTISGDRYPCTSQRYVANAMAFGPPSKEQGVYVVGKRYTFSSVEVDRLKEISLVNKGAYRGCQFTIER